jgi:hypothetical protein
VQLIAEAFVLTAAAALLGLTAAGFGLRRGMDLFWEVQQTRAPFWWNTDLSATTVLYVVALALLGASIIGGIPGARATGRQLRNRLTHSGGGEAMRFGAVATGVIIVQVALCVAFIPVAIINGRKLLNERTRTDFPAERFLTGRIVHETAGAGLPDRRESAAAPIEDVFRRIEGEPGVAAATRFTRLPGFNHPVEAIGIDGDSAKVLHVRQIGVDANFFDVVGARITNGPGGTEDIIITPIAPATNTLPLMTSNNGVIIRSVSWDHNPPQPIVAVAVESTEYGANPQDSKAYEGVNID